MRFAFCTTKSFAVTLLLSSVFVLSANAVPGGFTGRTLLTSSSGCGGCHGSTANVTVQTTITGPSSLGPGQTGSYTIKVTVGSSTSSKAGVNIAVSSGTLSPVSSQLQLSGSEITQNTRLARGTNYTFNYTAPASGGPVTIYATVAGDANTWNWASNVVVTLPIQLSSFVGRFNGPSVQLDWQTVSEVNNYGFFVLRRRSNEAAFTEVPNSFVAGHGTTNVPQRYRFLDGTPQSGVTQYRLRQVDLDGSEYLSEPIAVSMPTSVENAAPVQFLLDQNYPNPFNPTTTIKFALPKDASVSLKVYNLLGQEIATLVNENKPAGFYNMQWNGRNQYGNTVATGVYFYRIEAKPEDGGAPFTNLKEMMLIK